ncbi:MAG: hypothetical protein L0332_11005 [Chloroflexi bacterium]|nr:hypothetical protein [Chloroflexota bacterium]MCI0578284.1 hypothetical protein [Chloroflexota bacterium]MCI0648767.1 hypothetical protein [Chloroflexota bacterium]MCI0727235.1 hypothetical protein [Chloroflexota bacterium]
MYYTGIAIMLTSGALFFLVFGLASMNIYLRDATEWGVLGIVGISLGSVLITLSTLLGWHKARVIDFLLNQLSLVLILLAIMGLGRSALSGSLSERDVSFIPLFRVGFILVLLGHHHSTPPPSDE